MQNKRAHRERVSHTACVRVVVIDVEIMETLATF